MTKPKNDAPIDRAFILVALLMKKERTMCELCELLGISREAVRRYLYAMRDNGLVTQRTQPQTYRGGRLPVIWSISTKDQP
jgi:transcription initiation factor IIE alpha subunit